MSNKLERALLTMSKKGHGRKRDEQRHHKADGGNFIQKAIKHPGALHRQLKVPMGQNIPEAKLEKAEHSKNPILRKRAQLAETLKSFHNK